MAARIRSVTQSYRAKKKNTVIRILVIVNCPRCVSINFHRSFTIRYVTNHLPRQLSTRISGNFNRYIHTEPGFVPFALITEIPTYRTQKLSSIYRKLRVSYITSTSTDLAISWGTVYNAMRKRGARSREEISMNGNHRTAAAR